MMHVWIWQDSMAGVFSSPWRAEHSRHAVLPNPHVHHPSCLCYKFTLLADALTLGEIECGFAREQYSELPLSLLPACASHPSRVKSRTVRKPFAQGESVCQ